MSEWSPQQVIELLALMVLYDSDLQDEMRWSYVSPEQVSFAILCSDTFEWGTADSEELHPNDVPHLHQALKDAYGGGDVRHGPVLWVARKRQLFPIEQFYRELSGDMAYLFDRIGDDQRHSD